MSWQPTIYQTALLDGMPVILAQLIAAQAAHETGNFTSAVFKDCNNAFGYNAVRSFCLAHTTYQNYPTVQDSVHELTGWIKRRLNEGNFPSLNTITTPLQYATVLKKNGYYTDATSNYANGISFYFERVSNATGGASIALAGLFLFLIVKRSKRK